MGDSEEPKGANTLAWEKATADNNTTSQAQAQAPSTSTSSESQPAAQTSPEAPKVSVSLEQARIFLQDAQVQKETTERKAAFLRSKGISQTDIDELLKEDWIRAQSDLREIPISNESSSSASSKVAAAITTTTTLPKTKEQHVPIITYPEFMAETHRAPPLITMNGVLNTVYAFSGIAALVYGANKYVVGPMVNQLTEARVDFHDNVKDNLDRLVEKLEQTVSELPPGYKASDGRAGRYKDAYDDDDDNMSTYEDPAEMFHRDVGIQTSPPPTPSVRAMSLPSRPGTAMSARSLSEIYEAHSRAQSRAASAISERHMNHTQKQQRRLAELVTSVKEINDGLTSQCEDYDELRTTVDVFHGELEQLALQHYDFTGGFSLYGYTNRSEPNDEIKKAKENIRRVKGVLLTTRTFATPAPGASAR
ncbi:peroxisomal membrane anchor protein conserved region-domain-containing protein [Pseudoneurospora amorphoporcata]|uniref:Peroxisomal membrane protein PEX14 n=1 Tax=Pseudoneurospora amorphoporcata TaxID=241081 RepID=A0AAN6SHM5_9PEZI|nr:peroxisomal membrane anchor protein conserved region-domain-containing protein [Pseudoneurospora amorphoporcata]